MQKIFQIVIINILYVFTIAFSQLLIGKLFKNSIIEQIFLIIFYFIFVLVMLKLLNVKYKRLKLKKDYILLIVLYFSIYTVIYFVFEKAGLIDTVLNFTNKESVFLYFILLPLELFFVAILEELFFRKFMFSEMVNYSQTAIILTTSVLFSISHIPSSIIDFLLLFVSALIYGVIYGKTKSIKYSIGLHFITNFAIIFYGLHSELDFSDVIVTYNEINLFNNHFNTSSIIILLSEIIILCCFFKKPKHKKPVIFQVK